MPPPPTRCASRWSACRTAARPRFSTGSPGSRQKVANYAGVTVERKEGSFVGPLDSALYEVLDLPGAYSLTPTTLDEAITRDFLLGRLLDEPPPEFIVCVVDATNLRLNLRLVLELRDLGVPMVVALNMSDLAREPRLSPRPASASQRELGVPVVPTDRGASTAATGSWSSNSRACRIPDRARPCAWHEPTFKNIEATQREVRRILRAVRAIRSRCACRRCTRLDALVMHPVARAG